MEADLRASCSWTSTETAPYAFVRGDAKKRSATSRCTITHQRSSDGIRSRLSTTSGVATLYGQVRDELRRRRVERGEVELERVAEDELDVRRVRQSVSRSGGSSERSSSTAWTSADAVGEVAREDAEPGPDLEHDVARRRARRGGR